MDDPTSFNPERFDNNDVNAYKLAIAIWFRKEGMPWNGLGRPHHWLDGVVDSNLDPVLFFYILICSISLMFKCNCFIKSSEKDQ